MSAKPHTLSGLPTASEIALQRALDKAGWTMEEYVRRLDFLRDENGEPHCEGCGQVEKKRKSNGEIKSLTLNLKEKKLFCESCSVKRYKQQQRENVSKRQDREGVPTLQEFWARNRAKLSEAERVQREARHDEIISLFNEVQTCITAFEIGAEFDETALHNFIREVCREVIDYGFVMTDVAAVPFFKPEMAEFYALWTTSDQIAPEYAKSQRFYMEFGYLAALPEPVVHSFIGHVEKHLGLSGPWHAAFVTRIERIYDALEGKVWKQPDTILHCSTLGCKETTVHDFSKNQYLPPQWFCPSCTASRDTKAREASSKIANEKLNDTRADSLKTHDKWGREKIFGEDGPFIP